MSMKSARGDLNFLARAAMELIKFHYYDVSETTLCAEQNDPKIIIKYSRRGDEQQRL